MSALLPRLSLPIFRWSLLAVGLCALILASSIPAQEKQTKPAKGQQKEEVEDPVKAPRKAPLRVGDEDADPKSSGKGRDTSRRVVSFNEEFKQATHPDVKELYDRLTIEHDIVTTLTGTFYTVEPVPEYLLNPGKLKGSLTLKPYTASWARGPDFTIERNKIRSIDPYENIALTKVEEFLKSGLDKEPEASKRHLPRLNMLIEADKILSTVINNFASARERGLRMGAGWNEMEQKLDNKLREVQLEWVRIAVENKDWDGAYEYASKLNDTYKNQPDLKKEIPAILVLGVKEAEKAGNMSLAQRRYRLINDLFPSAMQQQLVSKEWRDKALQLVKQAQEAMNKKEIDTAQKLLNDARAFDKNAPGLSDVDLALRNQYQRLLVGVQDIPEYLSPARAFTDSELQALELLFESLVRPVPMKGEPISQFEPGLAADLPRMIALGREFPLPRNAYWSNGELLTAGDIRRTVGKLREESYSGRSNAWNSMMRDAVVNDSAHVTLLLQHGYRSPLDLMDFKILPQSVQKPADDLDFAKKPIGSGPYALAERVNDEKGERVIFKANPYYGSRHSKEGKPRIREIHFFKSANPVADFQSDKLHLLLGASTAAYKNLDSQGVSNDVRLFTLPNRRVYFLAINHRKQRLKANLDLRQALSYAIDRESILNDCFRAGVRTAHQALTGPFV